MGQDYEVPVKQTETKDHLKQEQKIVLTPLHIHSLVMKIHKELCEEEIINDQTKNDDKFKFKKTISQQTRKKKSFTIQYDHPPKIIQKTCIQTDRRLHMGECRLLFLQHTIFSPWYYLSLSLLRCRRHYTKISKYKKNTLMTKTRQIVLGFSDLLKLFPCKDGKKKDNQKKKKNTNLPSLLETKY